jgi:chloramphenicol-sensitive protein RarD
LSSPTASPDSRLGVIAGVAAYGLWGAMPLYFTALRQIPAYEILAQRIVWCAIFLAGLITISGRWPELVRDFRTPRVFGTFLVTSLLLSVNWLAYIYGVTSGQTVETSLGYFINPLLNVALGTLIFRERLRPMQFAAVGLALAGVLKLSYTTGHVPWIALTVATSFALYGLFRKTAPSDAFLGLSIETFILLPPACAYASYLYAAKRQHLGSLGWQTDALLVASGVITAVPLLCFGVAARNLRLSTLGFIQYIAPSAQFLLAVTVLGEHMDDARWACFELIWAALALYSIDTWRSLRRIRLDRAALNARRQTTPRPVDQSPRTRTGIG